MPDKLLVSVPRNVEQEPGYRSSEMFNTGADLKVSADAGGRAQAFLEPISRRWMGQPVAPPSTEDAGDYSVTGSTIGDVAPDQLGGGGVQIVSEAADVDTPWLVTRTAALTVARGFYLDLVAFAPESFTIDETTAPVTVTWDKWQLELRGGEQGQPVAQLYERVSGAWVVRAITPLLDGPLYNHPHRLWVQPLDGDEFLIANRGRADVGLVVRTEAPYQYDADLADPDADHSPDVTIAPWGPGEFTVGGFSRAFFVFRYTQAANTWTAESNGVRRLGYSCTQDVTKIVDAWLPEESDLFTAALAVYEGDPNGDPVPDEWAADGGGQQDYAWRVTVTGPEDVTGYSYRIPVLARVELEWPGTVALSSSVAVDLLDTATAGVGVLGLTWTRGGDDRNSQMVVALGGELETIRSWVRPYTRWQWQTERNDTTQYIVFDGLVIDPSEDVFVILDGTYRGKVGVAVHSRWAQADAVLFRGGIALDGYKRTEAYEILAKQMPLDVDGSPAELSYLLPDDRPVPAARRGQKPAFQPRVGTKLSDVFFDIQKTLGPDDRLYFRDNGDDGAGGRVAALVIDQPSATSQAVFYRTAAEAVTAGAPRQVMSAPTGTPTIRYNLSAAEFYNEIYVVGQAPPLAADKAKAGEAQPGQVVVAYYALPDSWQNDATGLQIGIRKTLVVVRPELHAQADVNAVCRALAQQLVRFNTGMQMRSYLVEDLVPGDVIETDPGEEPGATLTQWRIAGMSGELRPLEVDANRRYPCVYELAEVVA